MWKIGNIEIKGRVVLAPMAGITSLAYRDFMKPFGVSLTVTEMVSDCGLVYHNQQTLDYLQSSPSDHPVALQLFGNKAETIIKAMEIVEETNPNFDIIDINLGCPVPKVTTNGAGSSWLKDSKKLYEFMKKVVSNSTKPVTAKIRLGWNENSINFMDNIKALEKSGVAAIAIHARTAKQGYTGRVRFDLLKDLRSKMSVPLIVSGDIYTLDDAISAIEITGADAVMVARGGTGNPNLVRQIDEYYKHSVRIPDSSLKENIEHLLQYTDMLIEEKGERKAMMILRGIAPKFFANYPGCKKLKNTIAQNLDSKKTLLSILKEFDIN